MRKAKRSITLLMIVSLIAGLLSQIKPKSLQKTETKNAVLNWASVVLLLIALGILLVKVVTGGLLYTLI